MTSPTLAEAGASPGKRPSRDAKVALVLLLLTYTVNFIDRMIINILGQPIKLDLGLSDAQLGLLGGFSFALLYTVAAIPIARMAERRSRVNIISVSIILWSLASGACGFAGTFGHLLLLRIAVGVGEAGSGPASHSLVSDYYPPEKRSGALSVYALGMPLGIMLGAIMGGWLAENLSWRYAFFLLGFPGILLGVIVKLLLREPERGHSERTANTAAPLQSAPPPLLQVARLMLAKRAFVQTMIGMALVSCANSGIAAFLAPYLSRQFALPYTTIGLVSGLVMGVGSGVGTLLFGLMGDRLAAKDRRWLSWLPAVTQMLAGATMAAAFLMPDWRIAAALLGLGFFLMAAHLGPSLAVTHNVVEPRMRATAIALLFFIINLIGQGGGPLFVGLISDTVFSRQLAPGLNAASCANPSGLAESARTACLQASAMGSRVALVIISGLFLWGAIHYFLAARRIREDLIC